MRGLSSSTTLGLTTPASPWNVASATLVVDAVTKSVAQQFWPPPGTTVGPLHFEVTANQGVSFSWLSGSSPILLGVLTVAVSLALVGLGFFVARGLPSLGWGLIVGGAVGNIADRIGLPTHHVVDFIGYGNFFVGNVADVALGVGVSVLGVRTLRRQAIFR